jgi:xylose isomerase
MATRLKNSVGIWAFSPLATRFMPEGYQQGVVDEDMPAKSGRVVEGLGDILDGLEYHYPGEINEGNAAGIQRALGQVDVYAVASGLHTDPRNALGAFTNPKAEVRQEAIASTRRAIDLAASLGAKLIIWPGIEGYNYPFQCDYARVWAWFIEGIQAAVEYANSKGVPVLLEHKNSEPAMNILMRNMGMSIYVVRKLESLGTDTSDVKLNMDWQHLIMNGENLAEYAALLAEEGLLGHQHANSGWGSFDDDNMVGTTFFMQSLEMARVLHQVGYGSGGERIGFDLFPYTEDALAAVRQSILNWEFIYDLAQKLDGEALAKAQSQKDAVRAYQVVYEVLGLNRDFVANVIAAHRA